MWKGMTKNLVSIPIDYVEKAVNWFKCEKGIKKIVMTGASTGAGYTLACASQSTDFQDLCVMVMTVMLWGFCTNLDVFVWGFCISLRRGRKSLTAILLCLWRGPDELENLLLLKNLQKGNTRPIS